MLCLFVLLGISSFGIVAIVRLENVVETFDRQWLVGTQTLGEIADLVSQFRIDQANVASATNPQTASPRKVSGAKLAAERRAYEISKRWESYLALPQATEDAALLEAFDDAWNIYLNGHRAWAAQPDDARRKTFGLVDSAWDANYKITQHAIDALIGSNRRRASEASKHGEFIVEATAAVLSAAAVLGLVIVGWVFLVVRNNVTRPLGAITRALADLAAGNRDVVVPESGRADEIGELAKAFEVFRANTFALEQAHRAAEEAQQQAQALARHDPLTGLSNRRVLADDLQKALARADRSSSSFAVLIIDLDRFKPINDIHGHPAGDLVLCEIAARLKEVVRKTDTLSRIGGDEFAIVCNLEESKPGRTEEIMPFADRVLKTIRAPIAIGEIQVEVDASIGVAFGPSDGADAEAVLRAADIAMYRAKRAGRGIFRFYEPSMDEELRARAALEGDVRRAVAAGEIEPFYQPLVDLKTSRTVGFEVLARWNHREKGEIEPDVFIPIIEYLGLVGEFTWRMLRRACLDASNWPSDLQLSVNVSPTQLTNPSFPARLLSVLYDTGFSPKRLEIEITETALLSDLDKVKSILEAVQSVGVKVSLDDFGTGYSSLFHLRELKLDKIKIDRSFIQSIRDSAESRKIVNGILGMAKSLNLPTTAEGIEDVDLRSRMTALGCEVGQGYFFARAMPAGAVPAWLEKARKPERSPERKIA
jgi:diguanylate cyclase (GGDEF)-like protein